MWNFLCGIFKLFLNLSIFLSDSLFPFLFFPFPSQSCSCGHSDAYYSVQSGCVHNAINEKSQLEIRQ